MSVKKCSVCQEEKLLTEFTGRYSYCKPCYNAKKRNKYPKQAAIINQTQVMLCNKVNNLQQLLTSTYINISDVEKRIEDLLATVKQLSKGQDVFSIKVKISTDLSHYLTQTKNLNFTTEASKKLIFDTLPNINRPIETLTDRMIHFEKTFGITAKELGTVIFMELDDLVKIIDSLKMAYQYMIDIHNQRIEDKLSNLEPMSKNYIINIVFDVVDSQIVIQNPLKIEKQLFLQMLKQIISEDPILLRGYISWGYYDKFWDILDVEPALDA